MIEGHLNPDLIPDAVHRRAELSPADEAHLLSCPECRVEWALVGETARLGVQQLDRFDAGRVATGVEARLAAARRPPRRIWRWPVGLAAAAALILAVWFSRPAPVKSTSPAAAVPIEMVLHELDSLNLAQLELVLATIPPEVGQTSHLELVALGDLNTDDLERVLRSLEEQ